MSGVSFAERVEAAAKAGFSKIGFSVFEFLALKQDGTSLQDLSALLDEHGVSVLELEAGLGFDGGYDRVSFSGEPPRWGPASFPFSVPYLNRETEEAFFEMAEAFHSNHMVVLGSWPPGGDDQAAELFADLCDRAADYDLKVAIEFVPGTTVPDAGRALQVVVDAGRANGGICVDDWHHFRGVNDDSLISAIPADKVFVIQLSDGPVQPMPGDYFTETLGHRRMLGEGDWDIADFLDLMWANGVTAPLSFEILSTDEHAHPAVAVAKRIAQTAAPTLDKAKRASL
jgi:sugar phosphate isomerase/epimerase